MTGRIVVFGATGYTGRLTAESLVSRGASPVLAGRSADRLKRLADELGGGETRVADAAEPSSVRDLVERGDVLVATVGPFARVGTPAVEAAIGAGAVYLDSTGEPSFIRTVFERHGPLAERAGAALVTAFGYDFVPGNVAGATVLREAGTAAVSIDIGYFLLGPPAGSGGTKASLAGSIGEPMFAWRGGRLVDERPARHVRAFTVQGRRRPAISIAGSEAFALPRLAPGLREVKVYLGWFGPMARPIQAASLGMAAVVKIPGVKPLLGRAGRLVSASTGGPTASERERTRSFVVAVARDGAGAVLAEARLEGPNPYTFTGDVLAWGAMQAAESGVRGTGALGPVDAFGLDELLAGCAEAGLTPVG